MQLEPLNRQSASRDERDAWCAEQRLGANTAVFYPGDELRCPATKNLSRGGRVVCGHSLDQFVRPGTQVVVRVKTRQPPPTNLGLDARCSRNDCRAHLEVFPILEATG